MIGLDIRQTKSIQSLIKDRLTPIEFLNENNQESPPQGIKILTSEECRRGYPDKYNHELIHEKAWWEYGVRVVYAKIISNEQLMTATQNLNTVAKDYSKEQLVNMLKYTYYAPYEHGVREKVYGDLLVYEVLCGNIEDDFLDKPEEEIKARIKNKYRELID